MCILNWKSSFRASGLGLCSIFGTTSSSISESDLQARNECKIDICARLHRFICNTAWHKIRPWGVDSGKLRHESKKKNERIQKHSWILEPSAFKSISHLFAVQGMQLCKISLKDEIKLLPVFVSPKMINKHRRPRQWSSGQKPLNTDTRPLSLLYDNKLGESSKNK